MKMLKFKRFITTAVILLAAYLLQSTVFSHLELAGIKPNLLLIVTAAFGFMRGPKEGMWIGLAAGLLLDVQCGDIIGFYGLIYLLVGALNGLFEQLFFDEDIKLPIVIYFLMFLLKSDFKFPYYLGRIIVPELIYTIMVTLIVYPLILWVNHKLEAEEKRSASKFV